jgi:hypothetical protein
MTFALEGCPRCGAERPVAVACEACGVPPMHPDQHVERRSRIVAAIARETPAAMDQLPREIDPIRPDMVAAALVEWEREYGYALRDACETEHDEDEAATLMVRSSADLEMLTAKIRQGLLAATGERYWEQFLAATTKYSDAGFIHLEAMIDPDPARASRLISSAQGRLDAAAADVAAADNRRLLAS